MEDKGVPNLDCCSIQELNDITLTLDNLKCYVSLKKDAMRIRLAGDIRRAVDLEERAARIYVKLPAWARW